MYAASHDGFALLCVAAALFLLARALLRGGPTMTPIPAPAATAAAILLALVLTGCGGPGRAFAETCPDEASCRAALAEAAAAYRASGAPEDAVGFFDRVTGAYPALAAQARPYRAYFLDRSGETRAAIAEYRTSVKEAPEARTYALLGDLLARIGDAPDALAAYNDAARLAPGDPHILVLVARALWETGALAEAEATLARVSAAGPDEPRALTLSGKLLLAAGKNEEAKNAFERAAAVSANHLECRYQLSRLAWREGRKDDARRWLQEMRAVEATLGRGAAD